MLYLHLSHHALLIPGSMDINNYSCKLNIELYADKQSFNPRIFLNMFSNFSKRF
jgi:hypothetical protein